MKRRPTFFVMGVLALVSVASPAAEQWEYLGGPGNLTIHDLAISGDLIFAATRLGLFVSSDDGESWKPAGAMGVLLARKLYARGTNVFVDTSKGHFLSKDRESS